MAKSEKSSEIAPELREFVKEHEQSVVTFCYYLLSAEHDHEEFVLTIFREFGDLYRRHHHGKKGWEAIEAHIGLYRLAWEHIRGELSAVSFNWMPGRDTRQMKGFDDDLLSEMGTGAIDGGRFEGPIGERIRRIDAEFRAPLVLKDVLKLEDEEIVRILSIRWGVYRHRLHRGRLELRDGLRGQPSVLGSKDSSAKENPW